MAGIVAVAFLVIAELVSYQYGQRKDALTEQQQTATNQRHDEDMARVQHDTAQANERAAQLEKQAAEAREGIARANAEAATARTEQERLKQLVVWRTITDQQIDAIAAQLSANKQTILIAVVSNDPEAMFFAGQITLIFNKAGWTAVPRSVSWGNWLPLGLHIYGPDNDTVRALRQSFAAARVQFIPEGPPRDPDASITFQQGIETTATILVGSKIGPY
jgi:multidrug efflux pump subunit AcrA (membrane-fusion protein)